MAGAYCQFCGQRCFVSRQVIAAGTLVWAGHMATCESGKEHDRKVLGMDSDTAHNPIRNDCACLNVCGPRATVEATNHDASMNEPIGVVGGDAIRCVHGSSECCADYGDTAIDSPLSFQDKLDRDHAALGEHTECQGADFSRIAAVLGEGVEEHIRRDGLSPIKAALFRSRGGHAPGEVCPSDLNPAPIHAPDCELLYDGDECTCDAWRRQAKPDAAPNPGEVDRG